MSGSHSFDVGDAKKFGIEKAILLSHLRFWLDKNKANDKNRFRADDGNEYWFTYMTLEAFCELFPYMSKSKISKKLLELEDEGVVISGRFSRNSYDRTKYYSLRNEHVCPNSQIVEMDFPDSGDRSSDSGKCSTYKDIKPDIETDNSEKLEVTEKTEVVTSIKVRKANKRDPFIAVILDFMSTEAAKVSGRQWKEIQQAIDELLEMDVKPEEVQRRCIEYHAQMPNLAHTPRALMNNWSRLEAAPETAKIEGTLNAMQLLRNA